MGWVPGASPPATETCQLVMSSPDPPPLLKEMVQFWDFFFSRRVHCQELEKLTEGPLAVMRWPRNSVLRRQETT